MSGLLLSDFIKNWNIDINFGLNQYKIQEKSASRAFSSVQTNGRDDFNRCFAGIRTRRNNGNSNMDIQKPRLSAKCQLIH